MVQTKLLICEESQLKLLCDKHKLQTVIANLSAELSELGASDIVSFKSYTKTDGISASDIKFIYNTGANSVVFVAQGTSDDLSTLEMHLHLYGIEAAIYELPNSTIIETNKNKFEIILNDWSKLTYLVRAYNRHKRLVVDRFTNYLTMSDIVYSQFVNDSNILREAGCSSNTKCFNKEKEAVAYINNVYGAEIPDNLKTFTLMNRFMYTTAAFYDIRYSRL